MAMQPHSTYRTPSDIYPCVAYEHAHAAIDWLCKAFGFTLQLMVPDDRDGVSHAELSLGTGVLMVSSSKPEIRLFPARHPQGAPVTLSVFVAEPDAHHARAVAAGARIVSALRDEEYGARGYGVEDLEGNQWWFGNYRAGGYWDKPPAT